MVYIENYFIYEGIGEEKKNKIRYINVDQTIIFRP